MKIIVNNQGASSIIDTSDANMDEVMEMVVGALIQEGFPHSTIVKGFSEMLDDLKQTS